MVQFFDAWLGLYAKQDLAEDTSADQRAGQGLVEYALIIWFVAIVVFLAVLFLRDKINVAYSRIGNSIPD
jgi:Flp pilus assembly pilin Flp